MSTPNSPFGTPSGGYGSPPGGGGYGAPAGGNFGQPSGGSFGQPGGGYGAPPPSAPFGGAPLGPGPGGPYGAPPQSPMPMGGPPPPAPARRGLGGILIAAPIALVVGGAIGFLIASLGLGTLPKGEVEAQVTAVLQADFGLSEVQGVACPDKIENSQGDSFQCTFEYSGQQQSVTVTIGSKDGQLVVGAPGA